MTRAKRKPTAHGKIYFFDVGVANVLAGRTEANPGSYRELSFWRTANGTEVDFVVADEMAIEVKELRALIPATFKDFVGLATSVALWRHPRPVDP